MKNVNFVALPNSLDRYVVGEDAVVYERSFGTGELKRLERELPLVKKQAISWTGYLEKLSTKCIFCMSLATSLGFYL